MPYNSHTDQYYSPPSSGEIMTLTYLEQAQRAVNNYMLHTVGLGDKALSLIHLELYLLPAVQQYLKYSGGHSYGHKQVRWLISNAFKLYIDTSNNTSAEARKEAILKNATSLPATGTTGTAQS